MCVYVCVYGWLIEREGRGQAWTCSTVQLLTNINIPGVLFHSRRSCRLKPPPTFPADSRQSIQLVQSAINITGHNGYYVFLDSVFSFNVLSSGCINFYSST